MKLKTIYQEIIKKGIEADIRSKKEIDNYFKEKKSAYDKLEKFQKEVFDVDSLINPFADTRILNGEPDCDIKSVIVGVDVNEAELLLIDRLREKGTQIDLAISHHPSGKALASLYDVMDLQIFAYNNEGISLSASENLLLERKAEIERRIHAANHQKVVDVARWLKVNLLCMHTPCDNLAYQYIKKLMDKEKPSTIANIVELLNEIPEYKESAKNNNGVMIEIGSNRSKCSRIHIEFTGGTEGPIGVYDKLASCGVDTIIAMHQSEEHFKKCKEHNINVVVAPHIASDNLGVNLMLDYLTNKEKIKIYEFAGFRRFPRKNK
ncbi:MAG: NGG1p interacting factor NIF3 [Candidatus Omnitrophica bacterium]|nr:NGG1p interacting factor NIF3 [Candidatus Omnitrophota bacterium]